MQLAWEQNIQERRAARSADRRTPKRDREREYELARKDRELKERESEIRATAASLRTLKNQIDAGGQITLDKIELMRRAELAEVNVSRQQREIQTLMNQNRALRSQLERMNEIVRESQRLQEENERIRVLTGWQDYPEK